MDPDLFKEAPIAALLMLCDELAVWSRPTILPPPRNEPSEQVTYKLSVGNAIRAVRLGLDRDELKIELKYPLPNEPHDKRLDHELREKNPAFRGQFFGRTIAPVTRIP